VTVGTKSLLVGVHQLYLHPLTVGLAWRSITGRWPTWREWVCIVLHDVGYVGVREMDGPDGARHPELGARLAGALFGPAYRDLVAYHSRHAAIKAGREPSLLCWADKLSILYECWWTYLPRARLSGEIRQYRANAHLVGAVSLLKTDREWLEWIQAYFGRIVAQRSVGEYLNP
jgi:hypothetical protein